MPTIGEQLRAAREAKGLAIDDAHRHTKIHANILHAMEEDRTADVLDTAYAKGFLRKYAAFLSIDPGPLVQEYLRQEAEGRAAPGMPAQSRWQPSPPSPAAPTASATRRWTGPAVIGAMTLVGIAFLGFLARDLYRTVSSPTVSPAAVRAAAPTPAPEPPPPTPKLLVPKSQALKLSVRAAQDCWMQIKADDKVLFQNVLGKGREELWTAADALELWVGNAAALTLTLNGRPLPLLGPGVLKGIRVTRYGLQLPKKGSR